MPCGFLLSTSRAESVDAARKVREYVAGLVAARKAVRVIIGEIVREMQ